MHRLYEKELKNRSRIYDDAEWKNETSRNTWNRFYQAELDEYEKYTSKVRGNQIQVNLNSKI